MMSAAVYNRKRPRLSSSTHLVSPSSTPINGSEYLRKKQQQYSTTTATLPYGSTSHEREVINLDSDDDDYMFKNDQDLITSEEYFGYEDDDEEDSNDQRDVYDDDDVLDFSDDGTLGSSFNSHHLTIANLRLSNSNPNPSPSHMMNRHRKKKRTKSLPQLSYSKVCYTPNFSKDSVLQKIGDVKTALIQHQLTSYTYGSSAQSSANRKFSFNTDLPLNYENSYSNNSKNQSSSSESFDSSSTSATSVEETPCDDKDGHYIINPGSFFANDRFQIESLLGQGTFGKVIKAHDRYNNCVVAIKIIRAIPKYRDASKIELRVLTMLKKHDPENVNQCIHLRECFDYRGHICIVTDILKISLFDFLDKNSFLPFPGSHIQAIARQLLRSVAFMHDLNLIHTDLKPENILLKDDSFIEKPYHRPGSPTMNTASLTRKILNDPKIYTIDFGSAIFDDEYHSSVVSTRHYRAPEIILGIGWSFPCDMWSVGCILVELITGDALFKTHENAQHLAMMAQVLQQSIDLKLVRKCFNQFYRQPSTTRRRSSNSSTNGNNTADCIANSFSRTTGHLLFPTVRTPVKLINEVEDLPSLADLIGSKVGYPFDMKLGLNESIARFNISKRHHDDYEFWYYFIDLIKNLLVYDPDKRLMAVEALEHKWFDRGIYDDGTTSL